MQAQTAEEVIEHYTKSMGGLDAFHKVATAKITGIYSAQDNEMPLTIQVINGKGMRNDVDVMGQYVTNVYFNGKGWKINPFAGAITATDVTGQELNDLRTQIFLANPLMDHKARGHQVLLEGKEKIKGTETYRIKLTNKDDGKVTTYFISTKDHGLIKTVSAREINGQQVEIETYYSDLQEFAGLKFFMTRDSRIEGESIQTIKYQKVELNVPVDEKIFNK